MNKGNRYLSILRNQNVIFLLRKFYVIRIHWLIRFLLAKFKLWLLLPIKNRQVNYFLRNITQLFLRKLM